MSRALWYYPEELMRPHVGVVRGPRLSLPPAFVLAAGSQRAGKVASLTEARPEPAESSNRADRPRGDAIIMPRREATQISLAEMTDFSRSFIEFEQRFGCGAAGAHYRPVAVWPDGFGCPGCCGSKAWWFCDRPRLIEGVATRSP